VSKIARLLSQRLFSGTAAKGMTARSTDDDATEGERFLRAGMPVLPLDNVSHLSGQDELVKKEE